VILVDSSVWIDYLHRPISALGQPLAEGQIACHPFVIGELACGQLARRRETLRLIRLLPRIEPAEHDEVLDMIESRSLMGRGLGWTDAHLLAAGVISGAPLWTRDRRLRGAADLLGAGFDPTRAD
jgi:predicted nucleic acid-binding protein